MPDEEFGGHPAVLNEAQKQAYSALLDELEELNARGLLVNLVFKAGYNEQSVSVALSLLRNAEGAMFEPGDPVKPVNGTLRVRLFYSHQNKMMKFLFEQLERLERLNS